MSEAPYAQSDQPLGAVSAGEDVTHHHLHSVEDHVNGMSEYQGGPRSDAHYPRRQDQSPRHPRPRPPPTNRGPQPQWPFPESRDPQMPPNRPPGDRHPRGDQNGYGRRHPPRGPPRHPPPGPHYRPPPHHDPRYRDPARNHPPFHPIPRPPPHSRFNNQPPPFRPRPPPSRPPHQDPRYGAYSASHYPRSSSNQQSPDLSSNAGSAFGGVAPPPRNPQRLGPLPPRSNLPPFAPGYGPLNGEDADGQSDRGSTAKSVDEESFEYSDYYGTGSNRDSATVPEDAINNNDKLQLPLALDDGNSGSQSPVTPPTPELREPDSPHFVIPIIREPEDESPPRSQPEPVMGGTVESAPTQEESNRTSGITRLFKSSTGILRPQSSTDTMTNLRPKSSEGSLSAEAHNATSPKIPGSPVDVFRTPPTQAQSPFFAPESRFAPGDEPVNTSPNVGLGLGLVPTQPEAKVGSRPDRLTVDAAKEEELRTSTTSLQGLIKRSLRLASNLERGKTSSKFGLDWMTSDSPTRPTITARQSSGSLNGIMKGNSPQANQYDEKDWQQSGLRQVENNSRNTSNERKKRGRRCCGMPLWAFIVVLVTIILLVIAAIMIPIGLIVIPNSKNNSDGVSSTPTGDCTSPLPCANGGTNVPGSSGTCECVCANGFTGSTCTEQASDGCTTISIGNNNNVEIGSALPAVLDGAQPTYDIPINETSLYNLFQAADMSCTSQNALVTFNGLTSRSLPSNALLPRLSSLFDKVSTTINPLANRDAFDANTETLTFARTAVLYIGQASSSTQSAIAAQSSLQSFFRQPAGQSAQQVVVGAGWVVNLISWTVSGGGAVVGGRGS